MPQLPSAGRRDSIEAVLTHMTGGDPEAASRLLPLVYDELKGLAARCLDRERKNHTLQPTALVHEAYLRIVGKERAWNGQAHFLASAANAMRRVLVDHARRRGAEKRAGKRERVTLCTEHAGASAARDLEVLELDDLLERLAALDERKSKVVEMRFFSGMTFEQVAEALGVARSTAADDWAVARAWLASELAGRESRA